ncbi:hypothetical protein [Patulibacter medicamentivorans]|nr:hypothetical protein [Patulibacter medicamentivorans]
MGHGRLDGVTSAGPPLAEVERELLSMRDELLLVRAERRAWELERMRWDRERIALREAVARLERVERVYQAVVSSLSWRITAPLRALKRGLAH